jgi:hypothetical protein
MCGAHESRGAVAWSARASGFCLKALGRQGLMAFGLSPLRAPVKGSDSRSLTS